MTESERKYISILQDLLELNNIDLHIKSIKFITGKNRCICVTFKEKGSQTGKSLTTSAMQSPTINTGISGERHEYDTEEENQMCHNVSMIITNYFWLWLSWYDTYIKKDIPVYGKNAIRFILSGHKYRLEKHAEECDMYTFRQKLILYNKQVVDGIFKSSATEQINLDIYDLENFEYVDPANNIYH